MKSEPVDGPPLTGDLLARLPLLLALVLVLGATVFSYAIRLSESGSVMPWESGVAMEAVRFNAGLPVYEAGHATHLYGPGLTLLLAGIFRLIGLNLLGARVVFSTLALVLALLLTWIFSRGRNQRFAFLAACLFLGVNLRTLFVFTTTQPDCVAALASVGALYWWTIAGRSWSKTLLSLVLFLVAMLLKQTAAAFALIPLVHLIVWHPRKLPRRLFRAAIPAALIVGALVAIRVGWPAVFAGMVSTPAHLRVYYDRALPFAVYLLGSFPLLFIALAAMLAQPRVSGRVRWVCSSALVLVPLGVWTASKSGGSYNSLLFAYLALTALVVSQLGFIFAWINRAPLMKKFLGQALFALAIVCSFFFQFDKATPLLFARCGDEHYDRAVAAARAVGSQVISPEDPTIAYRANGYFGRSLYFELDAHPQNGDWPLTLPSGLQGELDRARCVIEVQNYMPATVFERAVTAAGFHPVAFPGLENSAYSVWVRD